MTSSQVVPCQTGKKYTIPYVVFEKTFPCASYPPDEKTTFHGIAAECDGVDCTDDIVWSAEVKDANCDMTAHIDSQTEISITWDTSMKSAYDRFTDDELVELNSAGRGEFMKQGFPDPRRFGW